MEKVKILDKIKKLFALATSPNENEAQLAMEKASELLAKHNLSMADLQNETKEQPRMFMFSKDMGERVPKWKQLIYVVLPKTFDCAVLIERSYRKQEYIIIGQKEDVEMTTYFCNYFINAIPKLTKNYPELYNTKLKNDFIYGATVTVLSRLDKMYKKMETVKTTALVLANKRKLVDDYINSMGNVQNRKMSYRNNISRNAYMQGVAAGNSMNIHTPIENGTEQQKQIA